MTIHRFWPKSLVALACAMAITAGCGSDGEDTPDITLPPLKQEVAAGFEAAAVVTDDFLVDHDLLLASLRVLAPLIRSTVIVNERSNSVAAAEPCVPSGLQNKVFEFDTLSASYMAKSASGAPPGGVRYLLYALEPSGTLVKPLESIGFMDIVCMGILPTVETLTISVIDSTSDVTAIDLVLRGTWNAPAFDFSTGSGILRDRRGDTIIELAVIAGGTAGLTLNDELAITGGLEAIDARLTDFEMEVSRSDSAVGASGLPEPPFDELHTRAVNEDGAGGTEFVASVMMSVDDNGRIVNILGGEAAPLEYDDRVGSDTGILACFSGEYEFPLVVNASEGGGCATGSIDTPISQPEPNINAYFEGHRAVLDLLDLTAQLYNVTLGVLTP